MITAWLAAKFGKVYALLAEIALVLGLIVSVVIAIHHAGVEQARGECEVQRLKAESAAQALQLTVTQQRTAIANAATQAAAAASSQIEQRAETRTVEVIRYVHDAPAAVRQCRLDDDGLRIWSAANADAAAGPGASGDAPAAVPAAAGTQRPGADAAAGQPRPGGGAVSPVPRAPERAGAVGAAAGVIR